MRLVKWMVLTGILSLNFVQPVQAAQVDSWYASGALRKLGRGAANIITAPGEIIRMVDIVGREDGYVAGLSVGVAQGAWRTILRAASGVYEVVTFPIEVPRNFEPIIWPEFVFAHGSWEQKN